MDNLGHLADQLPRNGTGTHLATAEAELQSAFRTSALAITQLLKAAQNKSKKAFQAGYSTALQDVLEYLQQGLDIHQGTPSDGIAQVIDYIEARQEAVTMDGAEADGDEEPESSSSVFRPPSQLIQQNLLARHQPSTSTSTSTNAGAASSSQRQQYRKRQSTRSLSPNTARHSSSGPLLSTTTGVVGASRSHPRSFPSYNNNSTHSLTADSADQPRLQGHHRSQEPSHQLSSSLPTSPAHRHSALPRPSSMDLANHQSAPTTASTSGPADSPVSSVSCGTSSSNERATLSAHSPLTRLQARKERERDRTPRSRTTNPHPHRPHSSNEILSPSASNSHSQSNSISTGMKRRWTSSLLSEITPSGLGPDSEHNINLEPESSTEGEDEDDDEGAPGESTQKRGITTADWAQTGSNAQPALTTDMEMDIEGYRLDGNARPSKRVVRR